MPDINPDEFELVLLRKDRKQRESQILDALSIMSKRLIQTCALMHTSNLGYVQCLRDIEMHEHAQAIESATRKYITERIEDVLLLNDETVLELITVMLPSYI